jgi:hypothetical protein
LRQKISNRGASSSSSRPDTDTPRSATIASTQFEDSRNGAGTLLRVFTEAGRKTVKWVPLKGATTAEAQEEFRTLLVERSDDRRRHIGFYRRCGGWFIIAMSNGCRFWRYWPEEDPRCRQKLRGDLLRHPDAWAEADNLLRDHCDSFSLNYGFDPCFF